MDVELTKGIKEPICGWQWVYQHYHDLDGWTPSFEIKSPYGNYKITAKDHKVMNEAIRVITNK